MINHLMRLAVVTCVFLPGAALAQTTYYPATGFFNGFLNQLNIIECDNNNTEAVGMGITVTASSGEVLGSRFVTLPAYGSQHTVLNGDLADITDNIGTYELAIAEGQEFLGDKINCRTSIYRASSTGEKQFDYAYVLPVQNPQFGNLGGLYDSRSPSGNGIPTANWLSVVNFDRSKTLSGSVQLYNPDGSEGESIPLPELSRGGRVDIPLGHVNGETYGSYIVQPDDKTVLYDATLIRYNQDAAGNYNYAFPMKALAGACAGEPILASSMGNGLTDNVLEVANISDLSMNITLEVRDRNGNLLASENRPLAAYAQTSLGLSDIIDPDRVGNVGSARVLCEDDADRLAVQSTFYGKIASSNDIEWAYTTQARGFSTVRAGAQLSIPFNTFLGMFNWLKISDASLAPTTINFEAYDYTGSLIASGDNALAAGGTIDQGVHEFAGADNVGSLVSTATENTSSFSGEVLRVSARNDGDIGTIIQIPGIIQQAGIDGINGTGFLGDPQSLTSYRDRLTREEAKQLYARAAFGGSYEEINQAVEQGLTATVNSLLNFQDRTDVDNSCARHIDERRGDNRPRLRGIEQWWVCMMKNNPNRLEEKLALMWHDFFAASCSVINQNDATRWACKYHMDNFREQAAGNYATLLRSMTTDYLMLVWLNGNLNFKETPDENYAREFHELFSTGESGGHDGRYPLYTEADIAEAARAFTGWTTRTVGIEPQSVFVFNRHDRGVKVLYEGTPWEVRGNFDYEDMHEIILSRQDVPKYVGERIFTTFCHDHPTEAVRNQLGQMVRGANYEIREIVRTVLRSEACFSADARKTRVKDPVTFMLGFLNQTGLPMQDVELEEELSGMGLEVTDPPTVFGWPAFRKGDDAETDYYFAWNTQFGNGVVEIIDEASRDFEGGRDGRANGYYLTRLIEQIGSSTPSSSAVVDFIADVMDVTLSAQDRSAYITYMDTRLSGEDVVEDLFDAQQPEQVRRKVGGLLWLMTQHHEYRTY